jgi:hypothetical protein
MTRSKKTLLIAVIFSFLAWLAGTFLVGTATENWYTTSGTVNMLDPMAIERALNDPTFTASLSWGEFSLTGRYWSLFLPICFALGAFVSVLVIGRLLAQRK